MHPTDNYNVFSYGESRGGSISQEVEGHTTYPCSEYVTNRDIVPGEELFVSYVSEGSNSWFDAREIYKHISADSNSLLYSMDELHEVGHCLSDVKVAKSNIPLAGKGLFAKKDFKKGEIITISPALLLPKIEAQNNRLTSTQLVQNYAFAHPNSDFALFPIGLASLINHAQVANVELELYWWDKNRLMKLQSENVTLTELSNQRNAPLDIAYKATSDIKQGEEITFHYGEEWVERWARHLGDLNNWLLEREQFKIVNSFHELPSAKYNTVPQKTNFKSFIEAKDLFQTLFALF